MGIIRRHIASDRIEDPVCQRHRSTDHIQITGMASCALYDDYDYCINCEYDQYPILNNLLLRLTQFQRAPEH
jgi:hypothetical protein